MENLIRVVTDIQARVSTLDSDMERHEETSEKIRSETTGLSSRISAIEAKMESITDVMKASRSDIAALRKDVIGFSNRAMATFAVVFVVSCLTVALLLGRGVSAKGFGVEVNTHQVGQ